MMHELWPSDGVLVRLTPFSLFFYVNAISLDLVMENCYYVYNNKGWTRKGEKDISSDGCQVWAANDVLSLGGFFCAPKQVFKFDWAPLRVRYWK